MDENIEQLQDENTGPPPFRAVLQNNLDERILEAVKRHLLEPMIPRPVIPKRKHRGAKRKDSLAEFDPLFRRRALSVCGLSKSLPTY